MAVGRFVGKQAAAFAVAACISQGHTALSSQGYADLAMSEALVTTPYIDIAGNKTVCYGELQGIEDREYTPEECADMLVRRVETVFVPRLMACTDDDVWNGLGQSTKDALIEFSWNVGTGAYCRGSVSGRLNDGLGEQACDRILLYNKARINGKLQPVKGLTDRRVREAEKCHAGFAEVQAEPAGPPPTRLQHFIDRVFG